MMELFFAALFVRFVTYWIGHFQYHLALAEAGY
jgi:hypothetical protein